MKQTFMKFIDNEETEEAELFIYGDIVDFAWWEDDVSANDIRKKLDETNAKTINKNNFKDWDIVLFIDKSNSRPLNSNGINKVVNLPLDNQKLRKINFYDADLLNNETQNFYSAIETKSLDNIIRLLNSNFYLRDIVEYKKIDTEIYKLKKQSKSLQKAITSYSSDWVFIIYRRI